MRLLLLLLVAAPLAAQPVTPQAGCSYRDCAVRIEPAFFLGPEVVQGEPGNEVVVGRVGALLGGLEDVVGTSPSALEHVGSARRARIGALAAFIAGGALVTYATVANNDAPLSDGVLVPLYGGLALSVAGGVLELKAQREQSRAVWEYNRTLAGE